MEKPPLIGKSGFVALVNFGEGWKIEVFVVQPDDAILINGFPLAFIDDTIAEGIEATFPEVVPTHLRNALRLFGLAVDIGFQKLVLFLLLEEAEVALALDLLFETVKFGDISLLEFDGALDSVLVLQFKDAGRFVVIGNKEQWTDDKVSPFTFSALWVQVIVMVPFAIKTETFQFF